MPEVKLSEWTNAQKSRWIAEKLGWIAVKVEVSAAEFITGCRDPQNVLHLNWPDMVNDPAMTVMLLEKMASQEVYPKLHHRKDGWVCDTSEHILPGFRPTPSEAVADAFILWRGWKEE